VLRQLGVFGLLGCHHLLEEIQFRRRERCKEGFHYYRFEASPSTCRQVVAPYVAAKTVQL
jgi:hypothetical protein